MSADLARFTSPGNRRQDVPPEWKPRLEVDDRQGGFVVSNPFPADSHPDYAQVLDEFGLSAGAWRVTSVRRSRWQTYDERWLEAVRLSIVPHVEGETRADAEQLLDAITKWRPSTRPGGKSEGTFVFPVGDTQAGKVDGDGSGGLVPRFLRETEAQAVKLRETVRKGRTSRVCLPWVGDCIEGIWSQGGALRERLDLTLTEQVRVVRRLAWAQLKTFANLADEVVVPVVPGNHDEAVRTAGKMSTRYDDSWAVEAMSAVADMVAENDDLAGRVRFVFPQRDELTVTVTVDGTTLGLAHGHQFGGARDGALSWWDGQAGGRTAIGMADVLVSGHFHHLRVVDHGGERLWIQVPAMDGGSMWFKHRRGQCSPARTVSFWTADGEVWGLDPLRVAKAG